MKYEEACAIFGVSAQDSAKDVKNKYRLLMQKYHPDAWSGDGDDLKHAQAMAVLINEAYSVLKREQMDMPDQLRTYIWPARVNPHALYERDIYMTIEDGRLRRMGSFKIARGRYVWDPDLEDFDMFMASVMELARELLNQAERRKQTERVDDVLRSSYLAKLVAGLSEHYVYPEECLEKQMSVAAHESADHKLYSMNAYVGLMDYQAVMAAKELKEAAFLYPEGIHENKLLVKDDRGRRLGHLSFSDDSLYVTVIPLLKQKKCQIRMRHAGLSGRRGMQHLKVQLDLRIPKCILDQDRDLYAASRSVQRRQAVMRIIKEYESYISG